MSEPRRLRVGDLGYGSYCPTCGRWKSRQARLCFDCDMRRPGRVYGGGRVEGEQRSDEAVYHVKDRESIIVFRDVNSFRERAVHCLGDDMAGQIADGLRKLPDGDWRVEGRSTPESILRDLRRQAE